MKKKHSIGRFIVIAVLCLIFTFLTVASFNLSGSSKDNDFMGFARAIDLGIEYRGGVVQEYSVSNKTKTDGGFGEGVSANATRIKYLLENSGYDVNTYQNGDNIVIEFFEEYSPFDIENIINKKSSFGIKSENSATAEDLLSASDVESALATTSGKNTVVYINFTKEGTEKFQKAMTDNDSVYVFVDSSYIYSISKDNVSSYATIGFIAPNMDQATYYASRINSAKYDLKFEKIGETTYKEADATRNVITLIVLVCALFVLCAVVLIVMFKKLGLVGAFILYIGLLLQIILLQAVPDGVFVMTGPAMFASLLCMLLGAITLYLFFDKMHKEYKQGKVLYASVKFGYNKIWTTILDIYVVLLASSIMTYFFGTYLVKQFAMALMCGLAVYGLVTIVLTKFFTKWLTNISFKNKDYGFKREAHINELK